jgi:cytochrome c oxidase cbb3-type subunit 4
MLRFIQHNLTTIADIEWYPILSLVIFTLFFFLVILRVIKMSKNSISELGDLPFEKEDQEYFKNTNYEKK